MQIIRKWHNENKGMTFVELICAVAIFSLIGATICGVMIASAKNYQRDSSEIELQQEAQLTANQIQDIVMDATGTVTYYCTVGGSEYECKDEADALSYGALAQGNRTLKVTKNDREYVIAYLSSSKQIQYSVYSILGDVHTQIESNQLMAENVTTFSADLTDFGESGSLTMNLSLEKNDRSYASSYTITARNQPITITSGDAPTVSIITDRDIVVEPKQTLELKASVVGDTGVSWSIAGGNSCPDTQVYLDAGVWMIRVGTAEEASEFTLVVKSNKKKADGVTSQAQEEVTVHVRRVTGIVIDVNLLSGTDKQAGSVYRVTANVAGTNLNQLLYDTDTNYINPKTVKWNCEYSVSGVTAANQNEYYTITNETDTTFILEFNKTMQSGDQLLITALAKHPEGVMGNPPVPTNKSGVLYAHILDYYAFSDFSHMDLSKVYRGSDENQGTIDVSVLKSIVKLKTGYETEQVARFYRFREVIKDPSGARTYKPWVNWAPMSAEAGNVLNLRPSETYRFECDKDYELQIKFYMYKGDINNKLWPFDDTMPELNTIDAELERVKIAFDSSRLGISNARTCGNQNAPTVVSCNNEIDFKMVTENLAVWGFNFNHNQNCLMMKVEKLTDGAWVAASNTDYSLNITGITQTQKVTLINPGTYRVIFGLKNIPYRDYNYSTGTVSDSLRDYWLNNEATGDGIYYIKAQ